MSYFGYLSSQNHGVRSTEQSQTLRMLPVLDWPVDLFNSEMTGVEHHEEAAPIRFACPDIAKH